MLDGDGVKVHHAEQALRLGRRVVLQVHPLLDGPEVVAQRRRQCQALMEDECHKSSNERLGDRALC